ncbi:UDP-N-acetylbacillosamine N-acetyltransferase [Burkholderiaceae bacterium]|nr:UDP-N-acetylbacillosamine N-acetyltransferase [Burkholderiaceae bacterium]
MDKPLIVVGTGLLAEQVQYYLGTLQGRAVDAFILDAEYIREPSFLQRPVLDFVEARRRFPAASHDAFVAIGHTAVGARKRWFLAARAAGYTMARYVHPSACVAANVTVGENTLIQELAMVSPFVKLGENLMLCPQVGINHHTRVGSHCFFAPSAVVSGDADIGEACFIGAHATIRDRIRLGEGCIIGAGAIVMTDCAPGGVYRPQRTERSRETED